MKVWREIAEADSELAVYGDPIDVPGRIGDRQAGKVSNMAILSVPYFTQETDDTCAPACLRMALAFRFPGKPVAEAKLTKQCGCLPVLGCMVNDVYRVARRYKLPAAWLKNTDIEREVEAALTVGCPVLANVQLRVLPYYRPSYYSPKMWHSVLIVGMDNQHVYLHDPDPYHGGAQKQVERSVFFVGWTSRPYSTYRL